MKLSELAGRLGADVRNAGDDFEISALTTLSRAGAHDVSFVSAEKFLRSAATTRAGALVVPAGLSADALASLPDTAARVAVAEPWLAVVTLLEALHPQSGRPDFCDGVPAAEWTEPRGFVHATAIVDPSAQTGAGAAIGPFAVVGPGVVVGAGSVVGAHCVIGRGSALGEGCLLHPGVILREGVSLGRGVIVQPGAVLGGDGFKYETINGRLVKIPQVGTVRVGDHAEIGANTCVDRAGFTETIVGPGSKIDNLVQIGHNVTMGADCIVVSQVGIAGSTRLGDGVIVAAQAGIADNLTIGDRVVVMGRAAVKDDVPAGARMFGTPARPFREAARIMTAESRLPDLLKTVERLEARVAELEAKA